MPSDAQNFKRFLGSPIFLFSFIAVSLVHVQEIIAESSIVKFCPMFSKIFTALGLISYIHMIHSVLIFYMVLGKSPAPFVKNYPFPH